MEQLSKFFTKSLESVFDTHGNHTPVHSISPFHKKPTTRPFHERPTLSPPLGPHSDWDSKPPDIKTEPPSNAVGARESGIAFSLENFLWVVLSGFGVVVLMAIFIKLGGPNRRVRRRRSNVRPAPNDVVTVTLRPDIGNLGMASLLRLSDDLPPPYSECVRSSTNKYDIEEPPPSFSACFMSFTIPKDAEPQVHKRRQNDLIENGLRVESVPMNNSESVARKMRGELVFDNGRIVERLS